MQKRPVIKIPRSSFEMIIDIACATGILITLGILSYAMFTLPDTIPTHFDIAGKANGWGSKWTLVSLLVMELFIFGLFTLLRQFPHIFNLPVRVNEENAERVYKLACSMLSWLKVEIIWLMPFLLWQVIQAAQPGAGNFNSFSFSLYLFIGVGLIFATIIIYIVLLVRAHP